ncbi:hypothetical protein C8Q79DRAFT_8606 [Trametes meyenii]|nr:hypothetical protein C8Q79DRAFT_8606 [Trametes meyenii]
MRAPATSCAGTSVRLECDAYSRQPTVQAARPSVTTAGIHMLDSPAKAIPAAPWPPASARARWDVSPPLPGARFAALAHSDEAAARGDPARTHGPRGGLNTPRRRSESKPCARVCLPCRTVHGRVSPTRRQRKATVAGVACAAGALGRESACLSPGCWCRRLYHGTRDAGRCRYG